MNLVILGTVLLNMDNVNYIRSDSQDDDIVVGFRDGSTQTIHNIYEKNIDLIYEKIVGSKDAAGSPELSKWKPSAYKLDPVKPKDDTTVFTNPLG